MQLFELVSPRLFRPLAGPNRAFYAELCCCSGRSAAIRQITAFPAPKPSPVPRIILPRWQSRWRWTPTVRAMRTSSPPATPHTLAVGFLLRLRRTGWLEEQPGSYESEPTLAFMPEVTPLLDALEEILNPRVVTYTGKLYKAWQLLGSIGQEKKPLRECAAGGGGRP